MADGPGPVPAGRRRARLHRADPDGHGSQVVGRLLIQTGRPMRVADRRPRRARRRDAERRDSRRHGLRHYRRAVHATRAVLFHLGVCAAPPTDTALLRQSFAARRCAGATAQLRPTFVAYLECARGHPARSTVHGHREPARPLRPHPGHRRPGLASLAELDRQRHIEPYLTAVAARPRPPHRRAAVGVGTTRPDPGRQLPAQRHQRVGLAEAPTPAAGLPPRHPPTAPAAAPLPAPGRRPAAGRRRSQPHRTGCAADALLLQRATGMRIGELVDLELDCVHEVPGAGGLAEGAAGQAGHRTDGAARRRDRRRSSTGSSRTVPPDGRCHTRAPAGSPTSCSPTTAGGLRLHAARRAHPRRRRGRPAPVTPHQLRHTYATALVNAGVSLQA